MEADVEPQPRHGGFRARSRARVSCGSFHAAGFIREEEHKSPLGVFTLGNRRKQQDAEAKRPIRAAAASSLFWANVEAVREPLQPERLCLSVPLQGLGGWSPSQRAPLEKKGSRSQTAAIRGSRVRPGAASMFTGAFFSLGSGESSLQLQPNAQVEVPIAGKSRALTGNRRMVDPRQMLAARASRQS